MSRGIFKSKDYHVRPGCLLEASVFKSKDSTYSQTVARVGCVQVQGHVRPDCMLESVCFDSKDWKARILARVTLPAVLAQVLP